MTSPAVQRHLPATESYFRATSRHCDCDSPIGTAASDALEEEHLRLEAQKRRRKGWSEPKVQRWLEDKLRVFEREQEKPKGELTSVGAFLREVAATRASGIAVLLHMYPADLDESFDFQEESVEASEVTDEWLLKMKEDVLYRIQAAPSRAVGSGG